MKHRLGEADNIQMIIEDTPEALLGIAKLGHQIGYNNAGAGDADRADKQAHAGFLLREDVLDESADL
jgi:hypothetical protein